jgi:TolA-binding protein
MADMDDASPSEEQMGSDGFADEIAREARAEMGAAPDDLYARGTAAYDRGDWTAALDALVSFVAASAPGDPRRAEALYNVGASQVQLGQRDAARTTLERFVSLYPDHAWSESAQRLLDSLQRDANETMMRRQNAAPASEPASTTDE